MDQISVSSNPYGEMLRAPAYLSTIQYETQAGVCVCLVGWERQDHVSINPLQQSISNPLAGVCVCV